jgi:3-phenylpropionate/trans-cinnamate dioxygenase ferredoxin reductase component
VLISDETNMPYQKPPLSKGYLQGKQSEESIAFRSPQYYQNNGIELKLGVKIEKYAQPSKQLLPKMANKLSILL